MKAKPYRQRRTDPLVSAAAKKYPSSAESLLPILQEVQSHRGHLDSGVLAAAADALDLPEVRSSAVATFYSMLALKPQQANVLRVCDGPSCMACGGQQVRAALEQAAQGQDWSVVRSSCLGLCDRAPAVMSNSEAVGPLCAENAKSLISGDWRDNPPDYAEPSPGETRVVLSRLGRIDPDSLESAQAAGAYQSLAAALKRSPQEIVAELEASGLRGRGGAGFPAGVKMRFVASESNIEKYVVANADESEPTAFKDRVVLEDDPHLLLEGMAIAGYAVGASEGVIYIRGEYEQATRRLENAIEQAVAGDVLGQNILGGSFSFSVHLHRGAGAYICGEETALLESLEGRRGLPRIRPPYPTSSGFRGCPTLVNNVETLCTLPAIIEKGSDWHRSRGTEKSPGTKLFALSGHVNRPGLYEAPLGLTLRSLIDDFGGGMRGQAKFHMALAGGAAGYIVGSEVLDVPLDYDSRSQGVPLGCGGFLALDDSVDAADLLRWVLYFFEVESCGKCTPCRQGVGEARRIVDRVIERKAALQDRQRLTTLAAMLETTSLCGLGQSVAWPINSALENFAGEMVFKNRKNGQ